MVTGEKLGQGTSSAFPFGITGTRTCPNCKSSVWQLILCYTLFISFKLDNWFCVVSLTADPVMGLVVIYIPAAPERVVKKWM
jgi:hypothetical protein